MQLFSFNYAGRHFVLEASHLTGAERLLADGREVSALRNFSLSSKHEFAFEDGVPMRLLFKIDLLRAQAYYELYKAGQLVQRDDVDFKRLGRRAAHVTASQAASDRAAPDQANPNQTIPGQTSPDQVGQGKPATGGHAVSFIGMAFKLLKSANAVKVVLAGSALAGWSILFSWQFALVLIGVIVFHEYGHLRAMQKCGMKTKGIYLIPFVGGVAVGERAESYWDEVYISMMGPVFGLFMSVAFYVLFLATDSHFIGLVASVSALVNLFNLLPVYPLDGGHVVKSLVLSGQRHWGLTMLIAFSAVCFALAASFGFTFLSFFVVIGAIDLFLSRRQFAAHPQTPLTTYGMWFCAVWYLAVVAIFIAIIVLMAKTGVPGTEIATTVLES